MINVKEKHSILRMVERIIDSDNPRYDIIRAIPQWRKLYNFNDRVQILYDELCNIGYKDVADYVKDHCEKKYGIDIIIDHHNAELKKQSCGLYSNSDEENKSLKKRVHDLEKELANYKAERNNEQVCEVFAMFVQRYLKSKEHKSVTQREAAKKNINDIISELKMQPFLKPELLKYINDFDDEIVPHYNANTIIMNQHNEHYVGNVGKGGVGININED